MNKRSFGYKYFEKNLKNPQPRVDVGLDLSKYANSCIDISDGIAKDLKCICDDSKRIYRQYRFNSQKSTF